MSKSDTKSAEITRSGEVKETPKSPSTASPLAEAIKTDPKTVTNPDLLKENEEMKARAEQAEADATRLKSQLETAQKSKTATNEKVDAANNKAAGAERELAAVRKEQEKVETIDITLLRDTWADSGERVPKGTRIEHAPKREALANIASEIAIRTEDLAERMKREAENRSS